MYRDIKFHGEAHKETILEHGKLHVFANDEVFYTLENNVYNMMDNNLRIPRNVHMSLTPDAHIGVGTCIGTTAVWREKDGFISSSIVGSDIGCGIRVHVTNLHKNDIKEKEIRRQTIDAIETYVSTKEKASGYYADQVQIEQVLSKGLHALPEKFKYEFKSTLTKVENKSFNIDENVFSKMSIPERVFTYAQKQIGTLGSGNHFVEVQHISIDDHNRHIAEKWGLFNGQVVIMIHSGSRAWGAGVGRLNTNMFREAMIKWGVSNPDPNLVYAPLDSDEGYNYYNIMLSALNYAVVNRHMIAYGVSQGLKEVLGKDVEIDVLYDLMHNYALKEPHRNSMHLVHRKGATRALPAGHFLNPESYRETGHPALIPGSMGTSSYIMVGEESGVKNFYSICHGAGRLRSRRATKELITVDEFASSLRVGEDDEIIVNHRTLESILDECPQAYKDVDQIVSSVESAGLASVVAKCSPMAVIKGV